jgi:type I restriction enzyme M protein
MTITNILKDSNYKLTQFEPKQIEELENSIFNKKLKKGNAPYIKCKVRDKDIKLTPEEIVRQLFLIQLHQDYGYAYSRMQVEFIVYFGTQKKRADIVIMDKIQPTVPYIVIEVKKPKLKDGKEQLKSYCNSTGATMAIWSNGEQTVYYHRKDPNYFEPIPDIPSHNQSLKDILKEEFTIADLVKKDILKTQKRSLKHIILDMEDEVLANAGVDVFEEVFKLIFIKLFDELQNTRRRTKNLEFRNYGESDSELKEKICAIFERAKREWSGIFKEDETIELTASHLSVCVSSLQDVKLFNSNLDVIDDAFEYLVNKNAKGEKGQYFTPRYVIDMCVKMLNPQEHEYMIDTASGSCGFPIHTVFDVWKKIYADMGIEESHLFTADRKEDRALDYVKRKVFGIDFDKKTVRVARMLNIIAGDGHTNVLNLNSLDFERWDEMTKDEEWQDSYFEGWRRFKKLRAKKRENKSFCFDIVMANPPFAGDIKESRILHRYELGKKSNGKYQTKVGRDILFIERNLDMLKSGGRMAVVLPQGRFNNSSDKYIRDFIAERCRILAVVGLHGNVFKPHTGTKTSVLIIQKWDDKLCPRVDDYNIFFATMSKPSKDNSGEKIYLKNKDGTNMLDSHDHLIVDHDLFNHDGVTQDGIAEAFIRFAQNENFSFVEKKTQKELL